MDQSYIAVAAAPAKQKTAVLKIAVQNSDPHLPKDTAPAVVVRVLDIDTVGVVEEKDDVEGLQWKSLLHLCREGCGVRGWIAGRWTLLFVVRVEALRGCRRCWDLCFRGI